VVVADADPAGISAEVVDAVGDRLADLGIGKSCTSTRTGSPLGCHSRLRSVQARQQAWHHSVVEDGGRWDGQRLAAHRQGLPARWRQRYDATGGEVQVATLAALAGDQ
jgi:hypothetical protein